MNNKSSYLIALTALIISFASAMPAQAQLTLSLVQPMQTVQPGQTASFFGTLTNTGSSTVFLNGDDLGIPGLSWDDTPFLTSAPLSLDVGAFYSGDLFNVTADASVSPAIYSGSFAILGGTDSITYDSLTTQPFQVTIPDPLTNPVPEASSLISLGLLLLLGIGGAVWGARRRTSA